MIPIPIPPAAAPHVNPQIPSTLYEAPSVFDEAKVQGLLGPGWTRGHAVTRIESHGEENPRCNRDSHRWKRDSNNTVVYKGSNDETMIIMLPFIHSSRCLVLACLV